MGTLTVVLLRSAVRGCKVWRSSLKLGALGVSASLAGYHVVVKPVVGRHSAACKQNRVLVRTSLKTHDQELRFNWWMLWEFVSPDFLLLSVAVLVSGLAVRLEL